MSRNFPIFILKNCILSIFFKSISIRNNRNYFLFKTSSNTVTHTLPLWFQYKIMKFQCKKTILNDSWQEINSYFMSIYWTFKVVGFYTQSYLSVRAYDFPSVSYLQHSNDKKHILILLSVLPAHPAFVSRFLSHSDV